MPLPVRARLVAASGAEYPVGGSAAPIRGEGGEILGVALVFSDMTERRRHEAERAALFVRERDARAEAERASRAKDEFIATVSHELRTPLNAVLGWARLLRGGRLDGPATARAIEAIERSATTQAQIVDDLLDVSRIVRGQLKLDVRDVDLAAAVDAAADTVRPAATAKSISLSLDLAPGAGAVRGDPARLQQVVWNLLANAIKFTPAGGRVDVRLTRHVDRVRLEVMDNGLGIDGSFLPHLFERFRQADSSPTRTHGGLGLGLAIVRHLVEAHGGAVAAESGGKGKGAHFTVDLPLPPQAPPGEGGSQARTEARAAPAQPPPASLADLRVLVVDDDPDTLEALRQLLEQAGARVAVAASTPEALAALSRARPDVILSDIGLPGEDGLSLIRRVRAMDADGEASIPAAALTAYTQPEDRERALAAGYQNLPAEARGPRGAHRRLGAARGAPLGRGQRSGGRALMLWSARPMPFSEILGQDRAVGALRAALRRGALHHAYLFAGPEGVGKGTAARLLAQAANCEAGRADDACGSCTPCRKVARGVHPDVMVVEQERAMAKAGRWDPKGGRTPSRDIVVDQVRELVDRRLSLRRFEGRRRFIVLDPADAMNVQAQNALLKTLEEPPPDTTLVLVSSAADALLPTIRSRCLRIGFAPLPAGLVEERLVAAGRPVPEARLAASLAGGSLGRALSLDAEALAERRSAVERAARLPADDAGAWIAFARERSGDREAARETCELLLVWLRDVLVRAVAGGEAPLALADLGSVTAEAASRLGPAEALRRGEAVKGALAALRHNAGPALALERMLIGWFHG